MSYMYVGRDRAVCTASIRRIIESGPEGRFYAIPPSNGEMGMFRTDLFGNNDDVTVMADPLRAAVTAVRGTTKVVVVGFSGTQDMSMFLDDVMGDRTWPSKEFDAFMDSHDALCR